MLGVRRLTIARVEHPQEVNIAQSNQAADVLPPLFGRHVVGKESLTGERETTTLADGLVHATVVVVPVDHFHQLDVVANAEAAKAEHLFHVLVGLQKRKGLRDVQEGDIDAATTLKVNILQRAFVDAGGDELDEVLGHLAVDANHPGLGLDGRFFTILDGARRLGKLRRAALLTAAARQQKRIRRHSQPGHIRRRSTGLSAGIGMVVRDSHLSPASRVGVLSDPHRDTLDRGHRVGTDSTGSTGSTGRDILRLPLDLVHQSGGRLLLQGIVAHRSSHGCLAVARSLSC